MLVVSFLTGLMVLHFTRHISSGLSVLAVFAASLAGTLAELFSPDRYDTVTVPIVMAAVLLFLL